MEKVKVVKAIPGILSVGDILVSPESGADFCLEETNITKQGTNERFVSLDYVTVSENVPKFFQFEEVEYEDDTEEDIEEASFVAPAFDLNYETEGPQFFFRTESQVRDRYNFFREQFENAEPGSEAQVVFKNLMWFIEWLQGKAELV